MGRPADLYRFQGPIGGTWERELPRESDEQMASGIVGRLARATSTYLSDAQQAAVIPNVESLLLAGASNTELGYGMRKRVDLGRE